MSHKTVFTGSRCPKCGHNKLWGFDNREKARCCKCGHEFVPK